MDVSGKVALVTGGANGIGKAMVEILLQKQAKAVYIVDIDENAMKKTQSELEGKSSTSTIHICKCDVSSREQMEECFKQVIASYGVLHIVCNNAGIAHEVEWERMLRINLNGVIIGTKLAVQYMEGESCGGGVIINTSSVAEWRDNWYEVVQYMEGESCGGAVIINTSSVVACSLVPLVPVYATSKYAIFGFTREVATFDPIVATKKIRVNALCPDAVYTDLFSSFKLENEKYQNTFQSTLDDFKKVAYSPQELAQHFIKLIEQPFHGAAMFTPTSRKDEYEIIPDDTKPFRERNGLEEPYMQLRDAAQ